MSDKKFSKKNKLGSTKQKPLVESKAVQLGRWVIGHELNNDFLQLIRTHIESTVGSHRNDAAAKTRLRFFERGLANGDKPSILSFGLEQFYPIEDIKQISRDEKHTNVIFCIIKPPSLVYEVSAFRCPTEYEARQFAEQFKKVKDKSGTGFHVDLKEPADGEEMNWSLKTTELKHLSDVSAVPNVNGNMYETMTVTETSGGIQNVYVDKSTKTLHITTTEVAEEPTTMNVHDEPFYSQVDLSKKRAAREAAGVTSIAPQQTEQTTTTTIVKNSVDEPVVFEVNLANQQKKTEITKETFVMPAQPIQQQTTVVKETHHVVPAQTQQQTTVVKETHHVVPAQTQQQTTVVREAHHVVPAQTQQQTTVVREAHHVVPAQTQQQTTVVREAHHVVPAQTQQQTTVVREAHHVVPAQTTQQQRTVVKETHVAPSQRNEVVKETMVIPSQRSQQQTTRVIKETHSVPTQERTTKVVKEIHSVPKQHQQLTQVVRETHVAPRSNSSRMVREVEYSEVSVLNARIISLEQENRYLRELLKQHSINDRDLEVFMNKEQVTNGPLIDSVVVVGDGEHHSQQTVNYSQQGEAAITVGDYRTSMTRTDSDRSLGSFVKVRKHRGAVGHQVMDSYGGGSLRSQLSGSLYASSVRGNSMHGGSHTMQSGYHNIHGNHHAHEVLHLHNHHHRGDIITQTMTSPNSGYLVVPQGTFKKSASHGHTYITKPIEKVYAHPVAMPVDAVDGSNSTSSEDDDQVFEVDSPTPVKIV